MLEETVKEILLKNNNLRSLKNDKTIKSSCIRIINLFIGYGFYKLDEKGYILEPNPRKIEALTNFELLHLIESIVATNDKILVDPFLAKSIQSIDYIGKCWYYPKELSIIIFETTGKRHNYKKVKIVLNKLVNEGVCLRVINKKRQSMYRILFTYSEEEKKDPVTD